MCEPVAIKLQYNIFLLPSYPQKVWSLSTVTIKGPVNLCTSVTPYIGSGEYLVVSAVKKAQENI